MPFWQLCWELLGKSLKFFSQIQKVNWNTFFYVKFVRSEISFQDFPAEFLRFFPWKPESVECFSSKTIFGKLLVWTGRMQLWWYLRHFSPHSWKSSAQIHKLMEKTELISTDFSSKISSGQMESSFSEPSQLFDQKPENHQLKIRNRSENFFLVSKFFSFEIFWNRRGQFWQPSH